MNRYEFVVLFDVKDGNPNGNPDADNAPRMDPGTGHGLVTDVCIKRKIRNYIWVKNQSPGYQSPGYDIFIKEKAILNESIVKSAQEIGINTSALDLDSDEDERDSNEEEQDSSEGNKKKTKGKKTGSKKKKLSEPDRNGVREQMCKSFFDIRMFGAVLSTGVNAGQVRGPVQLAFARSIDPIRIINHTITRCAVATVGEAEKQDGENHTMGRKDTVAYGLYRMHGYISPMFASQTGFSEADLNLLWESILNMFENDRSSARGEMTVRKLIIFKHNSPLGDCRAVKCFNRVKVVKKNNNQDSLSFDNYSILIDGQEISEDKIDLPALA
jgi:CRISPR-associated protein Csd2